MLKEVTWCVLVASLAGCAAAHIENEPLKAGFVNAERRVIDLKTPDQPLTLVAISGGGSRAAALGWAVLSDLAQFKYTTSSETHNLADDIDVVSSVSGGSVIAAQFALTGSAGLGEFETKFLVPDNTPSLIFEAVNPLNLIRWAVTGHSRTDAVEAMLDRELFGQKAFVALNQPGRPYLILNATDMAAGAVFSFTPSYFDDICSDLDEEHISAGVAASSAVPIVLSPVALKDFASPDCRDTAIPTWIADERTAAAAPYINLENVKRARDANDLRHGPGTLADVRYLYLLDGGLTDNLAVHGLLEAISSPYAPAIVGGKEQDGTRPRSVLRAINNGGIKKLVVLVINARADPDTGLENSAARPGILKMIGAVTSVPIDSTTTSVDSQLEELLSELNAAGGGGAGNAAFAALRVYNIHIDFDQLRESDQKENELRKKAKAIPTLWSISRDNLDVIKQVAKTLLFGQPCFQRLLLDESIQAEFVDREFAKRACPQAAD